MKKKRKVMNINSSSAEDFINKDDRIIYSRVLGHLEIENGHKWIERDECWICK
jgi:hypothetical protein